MNKILILGIGNAQVDAIRYCKNAGIEVHACAYNEHGPGRALADRFALIDIVDIEAVCRYAADNKMDWVYSIGSDVAMPTIAAVSEKLGLPHFISYQTAAICQNKAKMRSVLGPDFVGNVPYAVIREKDDIRSWREYPCMLKPADSQGQRGVYMIRERQDYDRYYEQAMRYSRAKELIVERYIAGREISANVYLNDGKVVFSQLTDRIPLCDYPGNPAKEHRIPAMAVDQPIIEKTADLIKRVLEKLTIADGPVYFQIKLADGELFLIEMAPRLDGCHLWRLIDHYCGVDLLDVTFRHLTAGECHIKDPVSDKTRSYRLKYFQKEPGKIVKRGDLSIDRSPLYLEFYYLPEETVRPVNGHMEKIGYYIEHLK